MAGILIFSGVCQKVQNDKAEQEETVGEVDAAKDNAGAAFAAWPYRETARIMNDQIYLVRE